MKERGKGKTPPMWYTPWAAVLDASREYLQEQGSPDERVIAELLDLTRKKEETR